MDLFSIYIPKLLPRDERFLSGRRSCKGCGKALTVRIVTKAAGASVLAPEAIRARFPEAASITSQSHAHHDVGFEPLLSGLGALIDRVNGVDPQAVRSSHRLVKKPIISINRQVLMSDHLALERMAQAGSDALYICLDNEPYVDDLIARTAPRSFVLAERLHPVSDADIERFIREKQLRDSLARTGFAYVATACPSLPFDLITKVQKALACPGKAFILALTPCPTGWIFAPDKTVMMGMRAIQTGYFPLYEVSEGRLTITEQMQQRKPLADYLALQKRFMPFPRELVAVLQAAVDQHYEKLLDEGV
jgi:pyruvate ferredoxin oxidoreductase beta subunit